MGVDARGCSSREEPWLFRLRAVEYMKTRRKARTSEALYRCIGVEVLEACLGLAWREAWCPDRSVLAPTSDALVPSSILVTTSKAPVTRSDALVPSSILVPRNGMARVLAGFEAPCQLGSCLQGEVARCDVAD